MGKFMNKNELVLIILLILLFNFNGFCSTALNHIMYGKRKHTIIFLFAVAFLIYDIFIFHSIINHDPVPDVKFKNNDIHKTLSCEEFMTEQINDHDDKINQLKIIQESCNSIKDDSGFQLTETIVLNFITLVLVLIFVSTMAMNDNNEINKLSKRIFLGTPVMIVAILLFVYANVYKPF